ncbi:response regulator [Pleomorphomonas sp. JP5]|uniref:response regulator n=1 Tax=Pleomorphomonas sp. JP5 TaxID=2942998 RepID=UPI0020447A14|nr:response regulator [Pleomorphomonas sp. JP5]MCM5559370.1 response regulator transcription factor [Pleomorphomonas sp. JP5]
MKAASLACVVLLVDDHPAVLQGLAALLVSSGLEPPLQTSTIEGARAIAGETEIDLAIIDLSLERGDGLDLVPDLTGRGARVIVYSMFEDARTIRRSLQYGVLGYVTKRDDPACLLDAVDHVRRGESYLSVRAAGALCEADGTTQGKELSERERQVLSLMGQGESNIGIAATLGISVRTVETYYARISEKLDLSLSVRDLRKYAIRHFNE